MNNDFLHAVNLYKWNRNMLNAYWFMAGVSILAEIAFLIINYAGSNEHYIAEYILRPTFIVLFILIITEVINHLVERFNEYIIIVSGACMVTTFLFIHTGVAGLYNVLLLPILISAFYFQVRKVLFAFVVMVLDCIALFYIQTHYGAETAPELGDFVSVLTILLSGTVICIGIMHRGIELLQQLNITLETKQDLMVKNIIMDRLSKIDPLTELYNHITFHEYLDRLTEQSDQFSLPLQLSVLDIDNFKKVNDTFGHRAGDAVLKRVALILQNSVKPNDFVARYGGEEFAVLFTEKTLEESKETLETIRRQIEETRHQELQNQSVTISAGLVEYSRGSGKESFFHLADESLYIAKKSGKNRIIIS